ncbi:MAG TPA: hypothetical protein VLF89_06985 [Candidatus Saccharimonadales bacterium]|nr:hypothetical protein [Candidatus Saccharimonadales bacterium]
MVVSHELPSPQGVIEFGKSPDPQEGDESPKAPETQLKPGNIIELADIRDLVRFEDIIAEGVYPGYDPELWAARTPLRELIKPAKFNGTIANIQLKVMADPYDRLLDADKRGWESMGKQGLGKKFKLTEENEEAFKPTYLGFEITADGKSTSPGNRGQIQAELWYYRHAQERKRASYGREINRVMTKPKLEKELFVLFEAQSRRMGLTVLRAHLLTNRLTPTEMQVRR